MACPSCGRAVRAGARFCGACGTSLVPRCPACGAENEPELRFCEACGASLGSAHPVDAALARKVVTIVFADLIGSTALHERLDPESVRQVMEAYHRAVRAPVEAHGGTVVQLLGDGVMCAFGVPHVAEDDALRAVRAAVAVQEAFREFAREHQLADRVGLRVAVNTGEVVVSDDYAAGIGDPLNVAARLQQEAKDGDVLIGEATQRYVRERVTLAPFGTFALKGRAEPVAAFRVVSLERPAGAPATALVGRDDELRRILAVYEAAVAAPATRLAVLLGSPGLGKSRLLDEVARRLAGRATVLGARCEASGGATFAPLATALRTLLGIDEGGGEGLLTALARVVPGAEAERARIAAGIEALLAGTPASPEETFYDVRRLLAALATEQPVVLAIDDLHWAEPLLLDLIEHLVQWGAGVPLLVLAAARPELREARSSLASPGAVAADVVTLGGLDATAATRLAASVIGADALPAAVAGRVLTTSEGNPLFVRELARMLVNDGVLRREGERWTLAVAVADLDIPPTIQALLAARIERLRPEDRLVLERAAVVGRHFSRAAVAQLLPGESGDLGARLESLRRSELIEPDTGWFLGEPALRFHHVLIRDAAYRRVLKGTRAELHARLADWIEARAGEHDETLGWHLEQAHQNLRELGALDERGRALGERAARHLGAAGRRALARDDLPLASSLLGRALDRLDAADPARADLALDWCEALLSSGEVGPAAKALAELARFSGGSERLGAWHTCFTGQLAVLTDPEALRATAGAVAAAAAVLASAGDTAGEAKAHSVHATALSRLGEMGACEAAIDRALAAARRAHDRRRANAVLAGAPQAALWGPSPVTRASGRCLDVVRVLRITQGAPAVEAVSLRCQAVLEALRGRSEAARRMIASARRMVEELGITQQLLETDVFAGHIDLLEGDAVAAERCLRTAYEGLREHGLGIDAARAAALLGRALLAQGRAAEAEALSHESEALAGDDLKAAIAWRGVRAEALAERGEAAAAVELARAAVGIAASTDGVLDHADARLALAAALRAAGRLAEADAEEARATLLWEQKGATLLAERARREAGRATEAIRETEDESAPPRPSVRRVRPNHGTAHAARMSAIVAARDADAFPSFFSDGVRVVHHPTGTVLDRQETLAGWRLLFAEDRDFAFRLESLATLGDSLALCRECSSGSASGDATFDVGPYQRDGFALVEGDAQGRAERVEIFAADRLGDAIARLYERHAELLPEGPERARAAATARSVAAMLDGGDLARWAAVFAPDIEFLDLRTVGPGSLQGADALLRSIRALFELSEEFSYRIDDVLAVRSDALVVCWTNSGIDRASGGAFERNLCQLWIFGADGRITRWEQSDAERAAEALARFDALTAERPPATRRRVRPNAMTAHADRVNAAIAARAAGALDSLTSDRAQVVHHPTGTVLDRQEALAWLRLLLTEDRDLAFRLEPVATLGDSLALCGQFFSGSASEGAEFDVGPYQRDAFALSEGDAQGRAERVEVFPADRLGDAVARLYERYAERLPEGSEHTRAETTARSVAIMLGPRDADRRAAIAPGVEFVDHRSLGLLGRARGAEVYLRALRAFADTASDRVLRLDDVVASRSDALLVLRTDSGTDRVSGGPYERHFLSLWTFGADGLVRHDELFDPDHEAEALARFDELSAERSPPTTRRRVRPNAATRNAERFDAAMAARDIEALTGLFPESSETVHHPTGATYDRDGILASIRTFLADYQEPVRREEPLATLGGSLGLFRTTLSAVGFADDRFDVGPFEREVIYLTEADARGLRRRTEIFAADRLGDAIARLYARYAELLPEGPERARAETTARSLAIHFRLMLDESVLAPGFEFVDHRPLGLGKAHGVEPFMRAVRQGLDLEEGHAAHVRDVLDLRPRVALLHWPMSGIERSGGGPFERDLLRLFAYAEDGRLARVEWFDPSQHEEALARFEELSREATSTPRIENAATRAVERGVAACGAHDWERAEGLLAPGFRDIDRRAMFQLELDRDAWLASIRGLMEMTTSMAWEVVATRGERLALIRTKWQGAAGDIGPSEVVGLSIIETDDHGASQLVVTFDSRDLDAAYQELDARYEAGEAARFVGAEHTLRRFRRAAAERDWEALAAVFAPDCVWEDHRPVGVLTFASGEEYVASARALVELAPDAVLRTYHMLALDERGSLGVSGWTGTREGGAFEIVTVNVTALGQDGRIRRMDVYGLDQLDLARACFAELTGPPPTPCIENVATWNAKRGAEMVNARHFEGFAALLAPGFRNVDRRPIVSTDLDRDAFLETFRPFFTWNGQTAFTSEILATRGERLALARLCVELAEPGAGPSEIAVLQIFEVDEIGRSTAGVGFEPDALDAAYAELDARYDAGEAAAHARVSAAMQAFRRAFASRDLDAVGALFAPDVVMEDHRLLGFEPMRGSAAYLRVIQSLLDLAPDVRARLDHARISEHALFCVGAWHGTREGGAFEIPWIGVTEHDALGRIQRYDQYDLDQLDEARARFEALSASTPRDPLAAFAKPNAATAATDRAQAAFEARDWAAMRAAYRGDARIEDRRRGVLTSQDVDGLVADAQQLARSGARYQRQLVGSAGEGVALERFLWSGDAPAGGGPFEVELLGLTEVDEAGRIVAAIRFDPGDWRAAKREARARWSATDELAAAAYLGTLDFGEGYNDHDRARIRSALADGIVVEDHRLAGVGRIEGADAYADTLEALWRLAPDIQQDSALGALPYARHGRVDVARTFGTLPEGGAFEGYVASVVIVERGLIARLELFELEELDAAIARFEELRPDPLRIPPNAASRAHDRCVEAWRSRDWDVLRELASPDFRFEDRGKRALVSGDVEMWVENASFLPPGLVENELIGTAGERVALVRGLWKGELGGGPVEGENLRLLEVDADGRIRAVIWFDSDDRQAAFEEAHARFVAGEAAGDEGQAAIAAMPRAFNRRDWALWERSLAEDFVLRDQRTFGLSELPLSEWLASFRAWVDLAPDVRVEVLRILRWSRHGCVFLSRAFGTHEGGAFEQPPALALALTHGARIQRYELFDAADAERALARFEELCAGLGEKPLEILPR